MLRDKRSKLKSCWLLLREIKSDLAKAVLIIFLRPLPLKEIRRCINIDGTGGPFR